MDYNGYLKREIEKALFLEIGRDISLSFGKNEGILKKGEYPVLPKDMVNIAKNADGGLSAGIDISIFIEGMIYLVGCDNKFKYTPEYSEFLKTTTGIESYIIRKIEENKENDMKAALVYLNTLCYINPKKEYKYNRVVHLMNMMEKLSLEILEDEIVDSLEELCTEHEDFPMPHYHLGEYYLNKDMDKAKIYLRKCLDYDETRIDAEDLLDRIKCIEDYDNAVDLVKDGRGVEALATLIRIVEDQPLNYDAKYYLAVAHRQAEQYQKALMHLKDLTESMERQEVYAEIALNLAALYEFEAAIDYFKKALQIMPNDSGVICNIGVCHLSLGDNEEAKKAFALATRINPEDEIAAAWLKQVESL
ncbi:MAG: tetratricopeptide repeat protein [Clostridium sp.]|uniref:tetratricopeptide repeat protein n=1 Tax=Clostridium sp. TaxID=1506 RepID=UPI002FCB0765